MKISSIKGYGVTFCLYEPCYSWADGKSVSKFDSTIVEIETDAGWTGVGEACPLGANYIPSYAAGVRCGIKELAPHLIGRDPTELAVINDVMDYQLAGHPYVKSAIDVACWDILGKASGLSLCTLLGGRFGESVKLNRSICRADPLQMSRSVSEYKNEGYTVFQLKVGGNVDDDVTRIKQVRSALSPTDILIADANMSWLSHEAIRVSNKLHDTDVYLEQPCQNYDDCLRLRQHSNIPLILDESMTDVHSVVRLHKDNAADIVSIKLMKSGGLTKSKQIRDLCVSLGLPMLLGDTWHTDIGTSVVISLAHSTPEQFRFASTDCNSYCDVTTALGAPVRENGQIKANTKPGIGVELLKQNVGEPLLVI